MKVITEAILRDELKTSEPEVYYVPSDKILSPAAKEYLQQRKIKFEKGNPPTVSTAPSTPISKDKSMADGGNNTSDTPQSFTPKYVDYVTGAYFVKKPEHMTQLHGNVLVPKNHPRIVFRGKLDSLQSLIVLNQAIIAEHEGRERLLEDLANISYIVTQIMRCDILDDAFTIEQIIGLTHDELRAQSHDPMKFYKIKQMILPNYKMGKEYALLNQIRTSIRECEVCAAEAYREGTKYTHKDIIEELNRLSSAIHIMMCRYLAEYYK